MDNIIDFFTGIGSIIFWFIIILIPLVAIHEFGHLLFARLFKVKVVEYGIGIPPRTKLYKKWKGVIWSLNWLPLGGFAKIYGDHDAIDQASEEVKKNPARAREEYKRNRIAEVVAGKELQFFLKENNIDYNETWKNFETLYKKKDESLTDDERAEKERLLDQLETLAEWEMDNKLDSKEVFFNKKYWQKVFIIFGGVLFNFLTAWLILFLLVNFSTLEKEVIIDDKDEVEAVQEDAKVLSDNNDEVKVLYVLEDSPAEEVGLERGDSLLGYAGADVTNYETMDKFSDLVEGSRTQEVLIEYRDEDSGEIKKDYIQPEEKDGDFKIGVSLGYYVEYEAKGFWSSFGLSYSETKWMTSKTWDGFKNIGKAILPGQDKEPLDDVHSVVAIGGIGSKVFDAGGVSGILYMMAAISIVLMIFNLLPIPALDGGRLVILTINRITGKRNKKVEAIIITTTMLLLIALFIWITIKDIDFVRSL